MRTSNKTYTARVLTESKKEGNALKQGILERCESDRNLFYAEKVGVNNKGLVTAVIEYRLPDGTSTPTHINKMISAVGRGKGIYPKRIEVTRLEQ